MAADDFAPPGVLQKSQFFRPITKALIERSARLFDSSIRPSVKKDSKYFL
ncbi:MAG: hypothetical protein H6Q73_4046 [Firmicutes bacterium]|nr:hypothetical protein [Bacillota bacterium]